MHKKLLILLMMMLFLFPVSIQANEDIHIEITESGIQKTPADDILLQNLVPGEQKTYTLQLENGSKKKICLLNSWNFVYYRMIIYFTKDLYRRCRLEWN